MTESLNFTKMHGLGNDFVLIDSRKEKLEGIELSKLAQDVCDRHFGIGADGILIVWPSLKADARMQVINSDGSEAEMCGNGIRCFAKYLYESSEKKKDLLSVETLAGIMLPAILAEKGKVSAVEVDMGTPQTINNEQLTINNKEYNIQNISMGNPHAVIFADDLDSINLSEIGPQIENHPNYPNRTNVEFVKVIDRKHLEVRVWERGAGETLACGTGACAAAFAAIQKNLADDQIIVSLPGGKLEIEFNREDSHILMRGAAEKVFEGKYFL